MLLFVISVEIAIFGYPLVWFFGATAESSLVLIVDRYLLIRDYSVYTIAKVVESVSILL